MNPRFLNKTVLVTGGGSGMGEAFCKRFASEGASVAVLDVNENGGSAVAAAIREQGGKAEFIYADVTDAASMQAAVADVLKHFSRLDVAVNNAGIGGGRYLLTEFPLDAWDKTMAVNLTGVFYSMRAEIPAMMESGGSIINMASITSVIAHPMTAAYVASKHGLIGLTKSAALEWGHKQIRVNAVGPTWVRTPMMEEVFSEQKWQEVNGKHALGRCATMEEIAAVVAFLGSDEARIITGSLYLADGGYTAG